MLMTDKNSIASVVAIGDFDGVHIGHTALLSTLCAEAKRLSLTSTVYTFENCTKGSGNIYPLSKKQELIVGLGVERIVKTSFDDVKDMPAEDFVKDVLIGRLGAKEAVGCSIRFGKDGKGDARLLESMGIKVVTLPQTVCGGKVVSSSEIRSLLGEGRVKEASGMLGRPYSVEGIIQTGHRNGHKLGFPTANLHFEENSALPAFGVYAVNATVEGKKYRGICNIGVHPTLGSEEKAIAETHLFGFSGDIYGKYMKVEFSEFVRPETHFDGIDALIKQIHDDIDRVGGNR